MEYSPTSIDDVRSFLEGSRRAVLSTLGRDGGPHLVVVDYLVDRNGLLLNGRVNRRWVSNLRNDPRASALIHDHADVSH
jgi:nitroimidazol reductase NimA-like FMN-containing flavoprotein (pyridoxamine 5'-phosphate oxidase superfamily)